MGKISVRNLCVNFGETILFDNLCEDFESGELYILVGPSGGGKSSLLKVISGLFPWCNGSIEFDGEDILKYSKEKMLNLHKRSGFVFQNAALINNMSIFGNLTLYYHYHHPEISDEEIMEKLQFYFDWVGFTDDVNMRPSTLSTGERMMVSLIRAIIHEPEYIFFDEPIANIDAIATKKVKEITLDLKKKGKTMIMVTHDLTFGFAVADKIGILAEGKIIESGTREEIINSSNKITRQVMNLDH